MRAGVGRGIPFPGHIATTDGESPWAFRYSSEGRSRSLFFTRDVRQLREQYPELGILREVSDDAAGDLRAMGDLPGAWVEMPEALSKCGWMVPDVA
jgi:hypothetical protein